MNPPLPSQPDDYFDRDESTILELHLAGQPAREIALEVLRNCRLGQPPPDPGTDQVFDADYEAKGDVLETDFDLPLPEFDLDLLDAAGIETYEIIEVDDDGVVGRPATNVQASEAAAPPPEVGEEAPAAAEPPPLADQLLASEIGTAVTEAVEYVIQKWVKYLAGHARPAGDAGRPNALSPASLAFLIRALDQDPARYGYPPDGYGWTAAKLLDCLWRWGDVRVSESTLRRVLVRLNHRWGGRGFVKLDEADAATKIWSVWKPGTAIGASPVRAASRYTVQLTDHLRRQIVVQDSVLLDQDDLQRVARRPPLAASGPEA